MYERPLIDNWYNVVECTLVVFTKMCCIAWQQNCTAIEQKLKSIFLFFLQLGIAFNNKQKIFGALLKYIKKLDHSRHRSLILNEK